MSVLSNGPGRIGDNPLPNNVCGYGSTQFKDGITPWDAYSVDWPTNDMSSGKQEFRWNIQWGSHFGDTMEFRHWITREDFVYDRDRPLNWGDFEEAPFCTLSYNDATPNANPDVIPLKGEAKFRTYCDVPQRSGRHVIYAEWGRRPPSSDERFHSCIDVQFNGNGPAPTGPTAPVAPPTGPFLRPTPAPVVAPAPTPIQVPTGSFPSPTTPAFGFCFSALNKVEVQGKGLVPISDLEIGDRIRAGNDAFSPVLGFGKRQHDKIAQYLQLFSEGLEDTPLELTHDHMVFVSGKFVAASEVRVGDLLGTHRVVAIKEVLRRGAYAPVTESGDLVVGGVLASCYTSMLDYSLFDRHAAFHAFMAPFRAGWISRWSYDEDRAVWIRQWCPRLSSLKYVLSPLMQYLVSSVVVLIYVVSGVVWLVEGRGQMLLWFLLSLGIAGYRLKGCGRSKVKGL